MNDFQKIRGAGEVQLPKVDYLEGRKEPQPVEQCPKCERELALKHISYALATVLAMLPGIWIALN